jgi:membrane-associated protease RseP (regulator of RpoE activity)
MTTRSDSGAAPPSPAPETGARPAWRVHALLFVATVASVFVTGAATGDSWRDALVSGAQLAASLLSILVAHELGHYVAARIHKVDATLPFFIPMPLLSPFGTMGAVMRMRSTIPTRRALLDIGASGPLAGMVLAVPLYIWGIAHSHVVAIESIDGGMQLGSSLLVRTFDHFFAPAVPEGSDIVVSPVAFGAWGGMFVTMINLLPVGQLDGGHVAFALFGRRQNTIAQWVHRSMLVFFFVSLASYVVRDVRAGLGLYHLGKHVWASTFWLVWFEVLAVIGTIAMRGKERAPREDEPQPLTIRTRIVATVSLAVLAGFGHDKTSPFLWITWFAGVGALVFMEARWGVLRAGSMAADHPPTGSDRLGAGRAAIAILSLVLFALLFMPAPFAL